MDTKTGIVALVQITKHMCRILTTWRPKIDKVVADAVTAGTITALDAAKVKTYLDAATGACDVLKIVTGY